MVTLIIAGKPVNFGALTTVQQQARTSPLRDLGVTRTVTGTATRQATSSKSFQQSASIFSNILKGGELPETFRESVTTSNLIGLGRASVDISNALSQVQKNLQSQISGLTKLFQPTTKLIEQETPIEQRDVSTSAKSTLTDLGKKIEPFVPYIILGGIGLVGLRLLRK